MPHRVTEDKANTAQDEQADHEGNEHGWAQREFLIAPVFLRLERRSAKSSLHFQPLLHGAGVSL